MWPACPVCAEDNTDRAKFCSECGAPLAVAPPVEVRKTVTVLFCDLTGSTALGERLDPESLRQVMTRYFAAMQRVLERHGGRVEKFIGDAVVAVFGVPVVHEDDALRAVRAAVQMRAALVELNDTLARAYGVHVAVRIGVNTGEVVVGSGERGTVATGDAVNVAARLEQAAGPGEVLIGSLTERLVRAATRLERVPPIALKGKAERVEAWRVLDVADHTADARRPDTQRSPLVGRERELALLDQALRRCAADRTCQLFTVLGVAGVGKTRMLEEFLARLPDGTRVLTGRCLSYGDGVAFWPLLEMLRGAVDLEPGAPTTVGRERLAALVAGEEEQATIVERLGALAGFGGSLGAGEDLHWAVRRFVESRGRPRPVVLVIDDVHWAEAALLDLVEHLADFVRDAAVLLVCLARPEFLDTRPSWSGGKLNSATVLLEPLTDDDADRLIANTMGGSGLDPQLAPRVRTAAGGNPLFVEQLLAMLVDAGAGSGAASRDLVVPPSIAALLAARLDRLTGGERAALAAASVVGQVFYAGAVVELVDPADAVRRDLLALVRKDLIRPAGSDLAGEDGFRFVHVLVQDAAYGALAKGRRADLHERFARWLEKRADALAGDVDQFVGHHLERACRLRAELGPLDQATRALAGEAVTRLARAAGRIAGSDAASEVALLRRAADLLGPADDRRPEILLQLGMAHYDAGQMPAAANTLRSARELADQRGDALLATRAELRLLAAQQYLDVSISSDRLREAVRAALVLFEAHGFDAGLATAYELEVLALHRAGRWDDMEPVIERAIAAARRAGEPASVWRMNMYRLATLFWGSTPAADGLRRLDGLDGDPAFAGFAMRVRIELTRAVLLAMDDSPDEARRALAVGLRIRELGTDDAVVRAGFTGGYAATLLDDNELARQLARDGLDRLQAMGEKGWLGSLAAVYADLLLSDGDLRGAAKWVEVARETTAAADDVTNQFHWRLAASGLASARGDHAEACRLGREAVEWSAPTGQLDGQGLAHFALGQALLAAGDRAGAAAALRTAVARHEAKGNRPYARRARQVIADAGLSTDPRTP